MTRGTVIVTGGSGGIGAATSRLAATEGYAVCVNYLTGAAAADRVVADITAGGGRAAAVQADVADSGDVRRLFDTAETSLGPLCGLVNNAALLEPQTDYAGIDAERLRRVLTTNVIGAFLCAQTALERMRLSRGGRGGSVVNVSSIAARTGSPHEYVDYAASKGALDTMTVGLAREVAADGVRVNAVRPGFIATGMHARGGEPDRIERLKPRIPLGRGGEPEEVANAIVWLLSDAASFTTGAFIDIGGGV